MKMMKRMVLLAILMVMATATAFAQPILRMPAVLSDHMVLQEQSTVTIWGWADPNCTVTVTPSWGEAVQTKSHYDTSWAVKIQTPAATAEAQSIVIKTNKKAEETIEDILIGQVWLCSGQSNMNWSAVHGSADMKQALEGEQYPQMRLFTVTKNCTGNLQADCDGEWIVCGDEETKYFSAVGYFFGRHLFEKLNRPVGLINSSWGGTPIEMWMTANDAKQNKEAYDLFVKRYAKRSGWRAGGLYGAMIHPLRNFEIAGAIWYQGCSNAYNPEVYGEQQALMIHAWRKAFGQPDMPFYLVQLAPHGREAKLGGKTLVREQQERVVREIPNTGMVTISDQVEDVTNIHPTNKKQVGIRLGNWALAEVYKQDVGKYKPTMMKSVEFKGGRAIVTFENAEGGIECRGDAVANLEIADASGVFKPAQGMIDGEGRLLVWNKQVRKPVAVRYCFNETAIGNLFDAAGMPVAPFRSDKPAFAPLPKPEPVNPAVNERVSQVVTASQQTVSSQTGANVELKKVGVKVVGKGHTKLKLTNGVRLHPNRGYQLTKVPASLVGWDLLQHACPNKGDAERNPHRAKVTAMGDGEIYVLARQHKLIDEALTKWKKFGTIMLKMGGDKPSIPMTIFALPVKEGQTVTLPHTDHFNDLSLLAVQIDYVEE